MKGVLPMIIYQNDSLERSIALLRQNSCLHNEITCELLKSRGSTLSTCLSYAIRVMVIHCQFNFFLSLILVVCLHTDSTTSFFQCLTYQHQLYITTYFPLKFIFPLTSKRLMFKTVLSLKIN